MSGRTDGLTPAGNQAFGIPVNQTGSPVNTAMSMMSNVTKQPAEPGSSVNSPSQLHQQQQQLQQRQRMMLQQRAMQQRKHQQALQNFENQFYQLLMTLNRKPKRIYNFVEDNDAILKKYEQYRPSFEFHIYENNYKICAPANTRLQEQQKSPEVSSDGLILNKNNETLKEFLEYVARGRIPESIMEVLRDCNIQFYEGNLILQVYDHTNAIEITSKTPKQSSSPSLPSKSDAQNVDNNSSNDSKTIENSQQGKTEEKDFSTLNNKQSSAAAIPATTNFKRPRVYRTLLRPNDLTHYYDMMSYADHTRFSDNIYQQLESEVLALTKRNLYLDVPLDPYQHTEKLEKELFSGPKWDSKTNTLIHEHRGLSSNENSKEKVGHIKQHEEFPQHGSNYEQMMLIMSERTTTSTNSTFAMSLAKKAFNAAMNSKNPGGKTSHGGDGNNNDNSGRDDVNLLLRGNRNSGSNAALAAAAAAAALGVNVGAENNQFNRIKFIEQWRANKEKRKQQQALNKNPGPNSYNARISMTSPAATQQQQILEMQKQMQLQQQQIQGQNSGEKRNAGSTNDKPKPKKPRRTTKKNTGEATKKKRVTKKKQSTPATPASAT